MVLFSHQSIKMAATDRPVSDADIGIIAYESECLLD